MLIDQKPLWVPSQKGRAPTFVCVGHKRSTTSAPSQPGEPRLAKIPSCHFECQRRCVTNQAASLFRRRLLNDEQNREETLIGTILHLIRERVSSLPQYDLQQHSPKNLNADEQEHFDRNAVIDTRSCIEMVSVIEAGSVPHWNLFAPSLVT